MAASVCEREVHYFTYNDEILAGLLELVYMVLVEKGVSVGQLMKVIVKYRDARGLSLFDFVRLNFK